MTTSEASWNLGTRSRWLGQKKIVMEDPTIGQRLRTKTLPSEHPAHRQPPCSTSPSFWTGLSLYAAFQCAPSNSSVGHASIISFSTILTEKDLLHLSRPFEYWSAATKWKSRVRIEFPELRPYDMRSLSIKQKPHPKKRRRSITFIYWIGVDKILENSKNSHQPLLKKLAFNFFF